MLLLFSHLDKANTYCRILFIDFSSVFNTIQPHLLVKKLNTFNVNKHIIVWVLEFLSNRPQYVFFNENSSNVYDTAILGLIKNKNEISYRSEVSKFVQWSNTNYLQLNVNKTKEMVIDYRKKDTDMPLKIDDQIIHQVCKYKYLGVTIDEKLHWSDRINNIKSKANKRLYFVRKLGLFKVDRKLPTLFYKFVIESILSFCITCWGGNSSKGDRIKVERIIKISENPCPSSG